jgi:hypothetical protein
MDDQIRTEGLPPKETPPETFGFFLIGRITIGSVIDKELDTVTGKEACGLI